MNHPKSVLTAKFYALLFFVGLGTFFVHELAHWIAGVALGYEMLATPNHVWSKSPIGTLDGALISSAGPLITIAQALVGFLLVAKRGSKIGFALLYMAFFMRAVAAGISIFNPNDEARVSQMLGLGTWTIPLIVVISLFALLFSASVQMNLRTRDQLFCYLVASVVVSLIVGVDMAVWRSV